MGSYGTDNRGYGLQCTTTSLLFLSLSLSLSVLYSGSGGNYGVDIKNGGGKETVSGRQVRYYIKPYSNSSIATTDRKSVV